LGCLVGLDDEVDDALGGGDIFPGDETIRRWATIAYSFTKSEISSFSWLSASP
jgi:hypothetical protein